MNTELYKVIPFAEVRVGQEFEHGKEVTFLSSPWIKVSDTHMSLESERRNTELWIEHNTILDGEGSLVRIADCKPELDFDTWFTKEGAPMIWERERVKVVDFSFIKQLSRVSWNKAKEGK